MIPAMSRKRVVDGLLTPIALVAALIVEFVWRPLRVLLDRVHRVERLQRLQRRLARLPPGTALPLFLVPEAASRAGWVASAWLLLNGAAWEALLVYVLTKLLATATALWVYKACEPALLRVRWFARLHLKAVHIRRAVLPGSPRLAAMRARVRPGQLR
jgi:hypothetical protein